MEETIRYRDWKGKSQTYTLSDRERFPLNGAKCPYDGVPLIIRSYEMGDKDILCPCCEERFLSLDPKEIAQAVKTRKESTKRILKQLRAETSRLLKLLELTDNPIKQK